MNLTDRPTCPHSERLSTAKRASGERSDEFKGCGCTRFQSERAVASPLSPVSPAAHAIAIVRQSRLAISSSVFRFCRIAIAIAEPIVVERFETVKIHCHPHCPVVIEPVSANRLHGKGNFCGLGWRLSTTSRQGCRFQRSRDFREPHKNPVKCGTFSQYGPTLYS
jgi:hypothetical protein